MAVTFNGVPGFATPGAFVPGLPLVIGPPPTPPSSAPPFLGAGPGGDRTAGLWEQARTGCWQPPTGYGTITPGMVPLAGASLPSLSGRGYAGPPPSRATDTDLDWSPPEPEVPCEPPGEPVGEKILGQLHAAGDGLYEIGRAMSRAAEPLETRQCGQVIQIGGAVLICQLRGKHRMHEAGRIRWH